jgi:hypothetical protein
MVQSAMALPTIRPRSRNAWNYAVSIPAYSASLSSANAPSVAQPCVDDLPLIPTLVLEIQKRRLRIVQLNKEL